MKMHLESLATPSRRNPASRSNPVRLGALVLAAIFTASQMPAQEAPAATPQAATQQTADASAVSAQTPATNSTAAAAVPSTPSDAVKTESSALPEAPMAKTDNQESASGTIPPNVRAMYADAAQQSQSLAAPKSTSKGIQRPGMLVMGIAGIPVLALGTWIWTRSVSKDSGLKDGLGAAFTVPGALMVGFGFTLAFKPKNK
jgi:hypothetical protein